MITLIDKADIMAKKREGLSNRQIARDLEINRKTVNKYVNEYYESKKKLDITKNESEIKVIQATMYEAPKYDASKRTYRKYNDQIDKMIDYILENEKLKLKELGWSKQQLSATQIHEMVSEKFDIGLTTISKEVARKRKKIKEAYIKQEYEYGQRLEYDFGEVRLDINGEIERFYMAVLSSPASNFRWAYLYKNQKKDVFLDSQIKFFEMVGGTYDEVVYDNMRNVVKKFLGKHEKELNDDLVKLALYYEFDINVTNAYSGNEKGHVEGSVKVIRQQVYAKNYRFNSYEEAAEFLQCSLIKFNEKSEIEQEKLHLNPYKPMLNLSEIRECKVNKYSLVTIDNNHYSVPDYLVGKTLYTKIYFDEIEIYNDDVFICKHKKIEGLKLFQIDIMHYLHTFKKKPGALRNSTALKSSPKLKSIYDKYYTKKTIEFVEFLQNNQHLSLDEIINELELLNTTYLEKSLNSQKSNTDDKVNKNTRTQISMYSNLMN